MARIFRALLIAAVNTIKEFFAFATKECLEEGLVNITNNGCTDLGDGLYQGGSGKSLEMSDILPITNANSWEFQTRYTYKSSASQCTLLGYVDPASNDYKTPWISIQSNRMYLRINNMSVWQSTFILEIDKTYDIKVGFTGTAYYIDAKLDTDENYTNYLTQSSTTKQNNTAPIMLMDLGYRTNVNQYYNNGIIDMTRTKFIIDGITTYFWSEVLEVGDTAKLNDGMATSNYDWSAYQSDTTVIGNYTATGTIEQIKQIGGDTIYVTAEPEQDNKDATINTGKIYYAYTNSNDESVYTTDSPIDGGTFNLENATEIGTLTNNNGIYSGFSDSNYLTCTNFLNNTQNSFEVVSKIYLTGTSSSNCSIIDTSQENSTSAFRFEINSSMKLQCRLSNVQGSFTYFATLQSNTILQLNTWYFVKVIYNSSTGYALYLTQDESNWHDPEATTSDTSMINHTQSTLFIGDNVSSNSSFPGYIDLSKTFITIDNVTTPSILYDSSFQELNPQPEFTIMQKGLQNATMYGSLTENNGVYSGFSSYNFLYINTSTPQTSMDFIIKCNPSTGFGDLLRTQPDGKGILLRCSSGSVLCYLSSTGSGWNVLGGFNTGISMTSNTDVYVRITWNSTDGVYTFWQSSDGETWTERNSSDSGKAAPFWSGGNQTIGGCTSYSEHWYGSVDMKETSLTIDGNKTTFYSTIDGIIINSDNYIKTSDNDLVQPITATIETVDNTTINSVTVSTPTQGYVDIPYYAYTNANDESVYTTDSPIDGGTFNLENATNNGCIEVSEGWYQGGANKSIEFGNLGLNTANSWTFKTQFEYNGGGNNQYGNCIIGAIGNNLSIKLATLSDNTLRLSLSGDGYSWNITNADLVSLNKTLIAGQTYYLEFGFTGTEYYCKCETTPITPETTSCWSLTSPIKVWGSDSVNRYLLNYGYQPGTQYFRGPINLSATSFTVDGVTTTFGSFSNPSVLYENTGTTEFTPVALDPQPTFTVQNEGLENCINNDCTDLGDGIYQGGSGRYISFNSSILADKNNWEIIIKYTYNGGGSYANIIAPSGDTSNFLLQTNNNVLNFYAAKTSAWNLFNGNNLNLTLSTGNTYFFKLTYNNTAGYAFYYKLTKEASWGEPYWSSDITDKIQFNLPYQYFLNFGGWENSQYAYGPIDLSETYIIVEGQTTTFYNTKSGIVIGNDLYERNSTKDDFTRETVSATIETSANITTSNNDNVVSGTDWHLFNLTAPQDMTTYIQSSGIEFTSLNMPLLLKNSVGVGLLLKDGNNAYYRNTWIINRDYDLHFQEIRFTTNVQNPTITLKINNVLTSAPYYTYAGDKIEYIISKEGYCDYSGSFITSYTSKDGKITTINVELAVSNGTVDVSNYEYTLDNQGNMILTKYKGGTDTVVPNI